VVWDAATGQEIAKLRGHEDPVNHASFSFDNRYLLTASNDKTTRIWDATTGAELAVLYDPGSSVFQANFSSDGKYVITYGEKFVRIYLAHVEDLLILAKERAARELTCEERVQYLREDRICTTPTPTPYSYSG
jgi:WD40 repeat protein